MKILTKPFVTVVVDAARLPRHLHTEQYLASVGNVGRKVTMRVILHM